MRLYRKKYKEIITYIYSNSLKYDWRSRKFIENKFYYVFSQMKINITDERFKYDSLFMTLLCLDHNSTEPPGLKGSWHEAVKFCTTLGGYYVGTVNGPTSIT